MSKANFKSHRLLFGFIARLMFLSMMEGRGKDGRIMRRCVAFRFPSSPFSSSLSSSFRLSSPSCPFSSSFKGMWRKARNREGGGVLITSGNIKQKEGEKYLPLSSFPSSSSSTNSRTFYSPAKVNLFLRILGRRSDGFHRLASLFHTISLGDQITFDPLPSSSVHEWINREKKMEMPIITESGDFLWCDTRGVPTDDSNLIIKALNIFREQTNISMKFAVHLKKRIPAQGGLGGGSSNAATALRAANELTGSSVSEEKLKEMSKFLGSDVTFFLSKGVAYCTGRGEEVQEINDISSDDGKKVLPLISSSSSSPSSSVYIVKPPIGLSTALVYKNINSEEISRFGRSSPHELLRSFTSGEELINREREGETEKDDMLSNVLVNDLETSSFSILPMLRMLKDEIIECGFRGCMMSGSGTAMLAIGEPREEEKWKNLRKRRPELKIFKCKFIRRKDASKWYEEEEEAEEVQ